MKKISKIYRKKYECCGCNACTQICPHSAIIMKMDNEGFYYPNIDKSKCVGCGLCHGVCPIKKKENKTDHIKTCYVGYYENDSVRLNSSSGGIFTLLAEEILKSGGIVAGAAFDDKWMVHHVCISDVNDIDKLRGSKYLQSRIEDTFKETKKYLKQGRRVLFSGTECQISGLKSYLREEYDNLFTVDVLCHGVPSPKVWCKYIEEHSSKNNTKIKNVFFRNKQFGWKKYAVEIEYDDLTTYKQIFNKDNFMKVFLNEICLRPSCYSCKFKQLQRNSDITIGDCWGIENYMPDMDDDKGTSVVIIHSDKGVQLWDNIKDTINFKEAEIDKALSPYADSRNSVIPHINRKTFFKKLNKGNTIGELQDCLKVSFWGRIKRKLYKMIYIKKNI